MRNVPTVITGTVDQIAKRILAHRPMAVTIVWKHKLSLAAQLPNCFQDGDAFRGQGDKVIAAELILPFNVAFHPCSGNTSKRRFTI